MLRNGEPVEYPDFVLPAMTINSAANSNEKPNARTFTWANLDYFSKKPVHKAYKITYVVTQNGAPVLSGTSDGPMDVVVYPGIGGFAVRMGALKVGTYSLTATLDKENLASDPTPDNNTLTATFVVVP